MEVVLSRSPGSLKSQLEEYIRASHGLSAQHRAEHAALVDAEQQRQGTDLLTIMMMPFR
jgi:hypothetical protein